MVGDIVEWHTTEQQYSPMQDWKPRIENAINIRWKHKRVGSGWFHLYIIVEVCGIKITNGYGLCRDVHLFAMALPLNTKLNKVASVSVNRNIYISLLPYIKLLLDAFKMGFDVSCELKHTLHLGTLHVFLFPCTVYTLVNTHLHTHIHTLVHTNSRILKLTHTGAICIHRGKMKSNQTWPNWSTRTILYLSNAMFIFYMTKKANCCALFCYVFGIALALHHIDEKHWINLLSHLLWFLLLMFGLFYLVSQFPSHSLSLSLYVRLSVYLYSFYLSLTHTPTIHTHTVTWMNFFSTWHVVCMFPF